MTTTSADYRKVSVLGSGTFGRVWLVRHLPSGRRCVIKEVAVGALKEKDRKQALMEVEVLARCRHVNIIRYRGAFIDGTKLNIVMSLADGGDLNARIQNQRGIHFQERVIVDWFVQIVFALRYIHGLHIVHRDLKTQNIFISGENHIKVGDFGIAKMLSNTDDHAITAIGTPYYLSPEICQQQPYNTKSDMWSLGCVLYELCSLSHPFEGHNIAALVLKILGGNYAPIPRHYSSLLADLVSVLLRVKSDQRPTADQILWIPALQQYITAHVSKTSCSSSVSTSSSGVKHKWQATNTSTPPSISTNNRRQDPTPPCVEQPCKKSAVANGGTTPEHDKENIPPVGAGVKRARCLSHDAAPSRPGASIVVANRRVSSSAESGRDSVLARKRVVNKDHPAPTISLYKAVLRHAHKSQAAAAVGDTPNTKRDKKGCSGAMLPSGPQPESSSSSPSRPAVCSKTYTVRKGRRDARTPDVTNNIRVDVPPPSGCTSGQSPVPKRRPLVGSRERSPSSGMHQQQWCKPDSPRPARRRTRHGSAHAQRLLPPFSCNPATQQQEPNNDSHSLVPTTECSTVLYELMQEEVDPGAPGMCRSAPPETVGQHDLSQDTASPDSITDGEEQSYSHFPNDKGIDSTQPVQESTGPDRLAPDEPSPSREEKPEHMLARDIIELLYTNLCTRQQDAYPLMEKLRSDLETDLSTQQLCDLHKLILASRVQGQSFEAMWSEVSAAFGEVTKWLPYLMVLCQLETIASI